MSEAAISTAAVHHPISDANDKTPFGTLSPAEFYAKHGVSHHEQYRTNSRGFKLFTQWWAPADDKIIGCIAVVHGYTGESSWFIQLTSILFAKHGFLVCAIDHQGHGLSDALDGLIHHMPDINPVVDDCIDFFDEFRRTHAPNLPAFLYAESLGGAIALFEEWKRRLAMASPRRSVARPRAATALELLRVCRDLQARFEQVDVPMLISHGGEDVVCDPACVEELHRRASSKDKTLKIYPGMWHQMVGEEQDNVNLVFGDMISWLNARVQRAAEAGN
ncbi:Caffeoylshikimate esterase [Linum perenne]